jgi:type IV pilus assembly protein PilE
LIASKQKGITLIELMVVVVIVGILASIAVPSYREYMLRANRIDAKASLLKLAAQQEKFYLQNNRYATNDELDAAPPGGLGISDVSTYEHFSLSIAEADAADFVARADALGTQVQDGECTTFAINAAGVKFGGVAPISHDNNNDTCWGKRN